MLLIDTLKTINFDSILANEKADEQYLKHFIAKHLKTNQCSWDLIKWYPLRRDQFACQICYAEDVPLDSHHLIPTSSDASLDSVHNITTVCRKCHRLIELEKNNANVCRDDYNRYQRRRQKIQKDAIKEKAIKLRKLIDMAAQN